MLAERNQKKISEINSSFVRKEEQAAEDKAKRTKGVIRRVSVLTFVFLVIGMFGFMYIYAQGQTLQQKLDEKEELEMKLAKLEADQVQLEQDIENYNDLEYIAEIARRDYFLTKEGEILFKIPKNSTN